MRGIVCPKCSGNHNYSNDEFISKLISIFGDKYRYDKVNYISQKKKVIIICNIHGDVEKHPHILLKGFGCSKCESKNYKINTGIFIDSAVNIHGNLFKYDYVSYLNDNTSVKIVCNIHVIFEQTPNIHLSVHGCIFCSGRYKYTTEEFIKKSILTHGMKYDYSMVE